MRAFGLKQTAFGQGEFAGPSPSEATRDQRRPAWTPFSSPRLSCDLGRIPIYSSCDAIQMKMKVGASNDIHEREADRVAEEVMSGSEHPLQRACSCGGRCPKCKESQGGHSQKRLQSMPVGVAAHEVAPPVVDEVLESPGAPLHPAARRMMERRFGHDFSHVRVHADTRASESAEAVAARAYTAGAHIVFGKNQYAPHTEQGGRLLAHELAHVIQQRAALGHPQSSRLQRQSDDRAAVAKNHEARETSGDGEGEEVCKLHVHLPAKNGDHCGFSGEGGELFSVCALDKCCPAPESNSVKADKNVTVAYHDGECGDVWKKTETFDPDPDASRTCNHFSKKVGDRMQIVFSTEVVCEKKKIPNA